MGFSLFDIRSFQSNETDIDSNATPGDWEEQAAPDVDALCCTLAVVSNNDTIDHVFEIGVGWGAATFPGIVASVVVPAGAGTGGVPPTDLLATAVTGPLGLIIIMPGDKLWYRFATAVGANKKLTSLFMFGRF